MVRGFLGGELLFGGDSPSRARSKSKWQSVPAPHNQSSTDSKAPPCLCKGERDEDGAPRDWGLRLLLHGVRHCRSVQLIAVIHMDRLAIGRNRHATDANDFAVALVDLFNRVVSDSLERDHGVAWVSVDRIVLAVKLCVI